MNESFMTDTSIGHNSHCIMGTNPSFLSSSRKSGGHEVYIRKGRHIHLNMENTSANTYSLLFPHFFFTKVEKTRTSFRESFKIVQCTIKTFRLQYYFMQDSKITPASSLWRMQMRTCAVCQLLLELTVDWCAVFVLGSVVAAAIHVVGQQQYTPNLLLLAG